MTWTKRPSLFEGDVKKIISDSVREISLDGIAQLAQRSPVRTGRYRGNHNVGVGAIDSSLSGTSDDSVSRGAAKLNVNLGDFPVVYLSNGLPYAKRLEDGYSKQAKNGVYRPTIVFLGAKYKRIIK